MLILVFVYSLVACLATAILTKSNYHYIGNRKSIRRLAFNSPILFMGNPITAIELPAIAANGTIHQLSEGHHFFHPGWFLASDNGGVWQYLPELRSKVDASQRQNASKRTLATRADETLTLGIDSFPKEKIIITNDQNVLTPETIERLINDAEQFADSVNWAFSGPASETVIDIIDEGATLVSSTQAVSDVFDIIFDTLAWFWD